MVNYTFKFDSAIVLSIRLLEVKKPLQVVYQRVGGEAFSHWKYQEKGITQISLNGIAAEGGIGRHNRLDESNLLL